MRYKWDNKPNTNIGTGYNWPYFEFDGENIYKQLSAGRSTEDRPKILTLGSDLFADGGAKNRDDAIFFRAAGGILNYVENFAVLDDAEILVADNILRASNKYIGCIIPQDAVPDDPKNLPELVIEEHGDTTDEDVAVGVIDTGIAFAHPNFRIRNENDDKTVPDESRFDFIWLQDRVEKEDDNGTFGTRFVFGTILTRPQLNNLFAAYWDEATGTLDEDAIYERFAPANIQYERDTLKLRAAHGTQVLDAIAGEDLRTDESKSRAKHTKLYAVELPARVIADTSGASVLPCLLFGLVLLMYASSFRVKSKKKIIPLIVNMSLSYSMGPSNGSHPIVKLIEEIQSKFIKEYGREIEIVVPTGNHLQDQLYAELGDKDWHEGQGFLDWNLQPDDRTANFIEIWSEDCSPKEYLTKPTFRVNLTPPDPSKEPEAVKGNLNFNSWYQLNDDHGTHVASVYYLRHQVDNLYQERVLVALKPTGSNTQEQPLALTGKWRVVVELIDKSQPKNLQAWIARDDTLPNFHTRGRQSHFTDPNYRIFADGGDFDLNDIKNSKVKREGSLSLLATGDDNTFTVVNGIEHSKRTGKLENLHGLGDYRLSGKVNMQPGFTHYPALCDEGRTHIGILAAGRSGTSMVKFNGTSAASAVYTRDRINSINNIVQHARQIDIATSKHYKRRHEFR